MLVLSSALFLMSPVARADELDDVQRLYHAGQATAALQRADQYLASHPKDPQMRFFKGVMLAESNRNSEAIALLQKLSEDHPDLSEPHNNLAALHAAAGDYAKARASLEQALRTHPGYATAHENLGDVYAALAAQSYERALQIEPGNATVPPKLTVVRELTRKLRRAAAPALPPAGVPAPPAPSATN